MAQAAPVENVKHEGETDMNVNMATLFASKSSPDIKFLGQSQILGQES